MQDFDLGKAPSIARAKPKLIVILRIMKLTGFILLTALLQVSAEGLSQRVSISVKDAPLIKVFESITKQTGYHFFYNQEQLHKARRVSLQITNASLDEALVACFKGQPFSYSIVNKIIVVKEKSLAISNYNEEISAGNPPLIDVKGKVVNEKGDAVEGVTVKVKGTEKTTLTDKNGEFSFVTVENDAVLVFTHVSMEMFELKVSGKTELLISLRAKFSALGEVTIAVNTGYQKISKERFVGSYSQLDNAAYERRAGMDIIGRLDGTVTSVLFDKKSGSTNQLQTVQIRGLSTLDNPKSPNKAPLIILDNFPFRQDIGTINPNDVESISILKDAAATSIWGAQAGNGVIVITTKKGKFNQPLRVSVSSNISIQEKPDQYYYPQMSIPDFVDAEIMLFSKGKYDADLVNTSSWPVISPVVEVLSKRKAGKISATDSAIQIDAFRGLDLRRDLNKYVYRPAVSQQHYINLNGGNNLLSYSLSAGYNRSLNNVKNSAPDDQFTIKTNFGFHPIKNMEVTTDVNYSQSMKRSSDFSLPAKTLPYAQLADAEGNPLALPNGRRLAYMDTAGAGKLLDWIYRPLQEPGLTDRLNVTRLILLNLGLSYRFTTWLNANFNYQYNSQFSNNSNYHSQKTYYVRDLVNQFTNLSQTNPDLRYPVPVGGILEVAHGESISQNARAQLNVNRNFDNKHLVTALAAAELSETKGSGDGNRFYAYNKDNGAYKSSIDYITPFPLYGGTLGNRQIPGGGYVPSRSNRFVSFLGNASYTYSNRYTFYASARKDGSNVFGVNTNRKWKPLWSAGASWDISRENFYHVRSVPYLRLRASYGYTGNPGNATGLPTITYSQNFANLTNLVVAAPGDAPNPDLRWEKVRVINTALDFSLFNDNKLSGSIEIWQKKSTDVISTSPFAPSTGITTYIVNVANLKGNGFDLSLNSKNIDRNFKWETRFGLSYAKIIVAKNNNNLYSATDFVNYSLNAAEGKIAYGIGSYKWAGLDPLTGDPRGILQKQVSNNYTAIFNDSIGNQVFHGSSVPLYFGYIGNYFRWKNFTLSANITYRFNFYFRKPAISYFNLANNGIGHADYTKRWQKPGDEKYTNVPSFTYPLNSLRDLFYEYSEVNVLRGDNIRLQDVRLEYAWNNKTKKLPVIKSFNVFLYANNLNAILWRKNKSNLDPDFVGGSNFIAPTPRIWTIGANMNL